MLPPPRPMITSKFPFLAIAARSFHDIGGRFGGVAVLDVHLHRDPFRLQEGDRLIQKARLLDPGTRDQKRATGPQFLGLLADLLDRIDAENDGRCLKYDILKHHYFFSLVFFPNPIAPPYLRMTEGSDPCDRRDSPATGTIKTRFSPRPRSGSTVCRAFRFRGCTHRRPA